jgi:hypothetical protein
MTFELAQQSFATPPDVRGIADLRLSSDVVATLANNLVLSLRALSTQEARPLSTSLSRSDPGRSPRSPLMNSNISKTDGTKVSQDSKSTLRGAKQEIQRRARRR